MKISSKLIFSLLFSVLLSSCGGGGSSSSGAGGTEGDSTVLKLVTIGDSNGTGAGYGRGWPDFVRDSLNVEVINDSEFGRPTRGGLDVIRSLINQHQPTHILILLGTNDATKGGNAPSAIANLQAMADIATNNNVVAVIGTVIPTSRSSVFNQIVTDINVGIRGISNATIAEVRAAVGDGFQFLADDVHLSTEGQRVVARAFVDAVE